MAPPRKFDHDEARRLRETGLTYTEIGRLLGVSNSAVRLVCDSAAGAVNRAYAAGWQRQAVCPDCGAQTTRHKLGADRRCRDCASRVQATSVTDGALYCATCGEWKPDDAFPFNRAGKKLRRGRHDACRACATVLRQVYRERRKVPCDRCGKPRLPAAEKKRAGSHDTGLCAACYQESLRRSAA